MAANQKPSIGRVVHFVSGDQHLPAIITDPAYIVPAIEDSPAYEAQAMTVFPVSESPFMTLATFDPDCKSATWHWPEYVPAE